MFVLTKEQKENNVTMPTDMLYQPLKRPRGLPRRAFLFYPEGFKKMPTILPLDDDSNPIPTIRV